MNIRPVQFGADKTNIGFLQEVVGNSRISQSRNKIGPKPRRRLRVDRTESGFVHNPGLASVVLILLPFHGQPPRNRGRGREAKSEDKQDHAGVK